MRHVIATVCLLGLLPLCVAQAGGESMATKVKRADGKVRIEGMEGVNWGGSFFTREDSQVRCLVEALRCAGHDVSYADVMGMSGAAFKLTMEPNLFVAEIHSEMGMDWKEIMSRVWGLDYSCEAISCSDDESPGWRQQLQEAAAESIGRGMPLFYMNGEWNLLVGYLEDGSGFICKPYAGDEPGYQEMATPGGFLGEIWFASVLRPSGKPADRRESVVRSLQTALELASRPAEGDGKRLFGNAAYEAWIAAVESGGEDVSLHGNAFSYSQLLTSRQAAADYLRRVAVEMGGDAAPRLRTAADCYQAIYQRLWDGQECVMWPWEESWTPENRAKEATILRDCMADEKAAIAEIEAALRALSGTPLEAATSSTDRPEAARREVVTPKRFVLEGVPKVAYHTDRWRFTPFCNALDACLRYLGQEEQYDYLMCTSGAMFRMTWMPKAWDGGNSDILGMASEPLEPMRRAFWSAGYQMVPVAKAEPAGWPEDILSDSAQRLGGELTDEAGFRRRVVESINAGLPVIAFGVIGPPEACVLTGYDERGDVLLGWNVFQHDEGAETEPSGYFRVRDWYAKTRALLLIGDNVGRPDPTELDRETLQWALQVLRTPRVRDHQAGPAAFEAWAADMLDDASFPKDDLKVLHDRLMCHWDSMTVTATRGSGSATAYLLSVAERNPAMAEHLRAAADCLDHEDVVHGVAPGEEAHMARLADPAVRRQVADSILHARDMHVQAADHIEKALLALGS